MTPIRWAVLGTGPVSQQFSAALRRVPGAVLQAVFSRDADHARRFARQYGFQRSAELNLGIFDAPDIDVFYIATPTATHRTYCLAAIAAGKHLLCEKPMTAHPDELTEVADAARSRGVFAMEGMWLKFNPIIQTCGEVLARKQLGDILSVQMNVGYAEQSPQVAVRDGTARDALSVFGCYGFALAHSWWGLPLAVRASGRTDAHGAVLHAHVALAYPHFECQLTFSVVATLANTLELVGSEGRWFIPSPVLDPCCSRWLPHATQGKLAKVTTRLEAVYQALRDQVAFLHPLRGSGFRGEIGQVGTSLRHHQTENSMHPLAATLASHRMQIAARQAMHTHQWVPVKA